MNEGAARRFERLRQKLSGNRKAVALLLLGLCGLGLLRFSSHADASQTQRPADTREADDAAYCAALEAKICALVEGVTGSRDVRVALTLDTGTQYFYTDETKRAQTGGSTQNGSTQTSEDTEQTYVTVRSSDGGETALLRTRAMPTVRGVAIVCGSLTKDAAVEIRNTVTTALGVPDKCVYVVGRNSNRKGTFE